MPSSLAIRSAAAKALGIQTSNSPGYRCVARISNVGQAVYAIAVSPDGEMVAYGGTL